MTSPPNPLSRRRGGARDEIRGGASLGLGSPQRRTSWPQAVQARF